MIGVVGPDREAARLADIVEDAGESALVGDASEVSDATTTAIVAAGESVLVDLVRFDVDVPVLPVDAGPEFRTTVDAVDRLLDGEYGTSAHPVLDVRVGEAHAGCALFDVMLDTTEPGRISEYGIRTGDTDARFRADGVVAATPAGSRGYANTAGGPILERGVAAVSVVPIAAFELGAGPQVVEPPITLTVERDECPVSLLVDGREWDEVRPGRAVQVSTGGELSIVEARPGLEKH